MLQRLAALEAELADARRGPSICPSCQAIASANAEQDVRPKLGDHFSKHTEDDWDAVESKKQKLAEKKARLYCFDAAAVAAALSKEVTVGPVSATLEDPEHLEAFAMELAFYYVSSGSKFTRLNAIRSQEAVLIKAALRRRS